MRSAPSTNPSSTRAIHVDATWHLLEEVELRLPFWRYHGLFEMSDYSFLLDSAKDPEKLGQFSFLGGNPRLVFRAKRQAGQSPGAGARIEITRLTAADGRPLNEPVTTRQTADPFEALRDVLAEHTDLRPPTSDLPIPFCSGAVGYFGYESLYFIESIPDQGADDLGMPDIYFMLVDSLMAHCHRSGRSYLSIVGRGDNESLARRRAEEHRDRLLERLREFEENPPPPWCGPTPQQAAAAAFDVTARFDEASYGRAVDEIKEHIFAGDIYEACMTHRLESPLVGGTAWDLYQELRRINPAPMASYLNFPEAQVVSSSPERYVSLSRERIAESRPIKGTRPRGENPRHDAALQQSLLLSIKDRAENVMIVDLVRNDFGRVCKFGSIHVPELMIVEDYATVFQMVSTVRGELQEEFDALDLVRATFPGGSMTGAPKIEAMKIIDSLEPVKRGIYSGSIGYLDSAGSLDLNIAIRTIVVKDGRCYYNVGGAVVADSDPRSEYQETLDKARALTTALRNLKAVGLGEVHAAPEKM